MITDNYVLTAITAFATALLVLVGLAQVGILISQKRQLRIELLEAYRKRWFSSRRHWETIVFFGKEIGEFYQVSDEKMLEALDKKTYESRTPHVWALNSTRISFSILNDVCLLTLQGRLEIGEVYSIFGTEVLRNSRPLRKLLDTRYYDLRDNPQPTPHWPIRKDIQEWLVYHNGIRRRCLILLDLLWAEAVRLNDLPPADIKKAAEAKKITGDLYRKRLKRECFSVNGFYGSFLCLKLSNFLKYAEYKKFYSRKGICKNKLKQLDKEWTDLLLHEKHWQGHID